MPVPEVGRRQAVSSAVLDACGTAVKPDARPPDSSRWPSVPAPPNSGTRPPYPRRGLLSGMFRYGGCWPSAAARLSTQRHGAHIAGRIRSRQDPSGSRDKYPVSKMPYRTQMWAAADGLWKGTTQ